MILTLFSFSTFGLFAQTEADEEPTMQADEASETVKPKKEKIEQQRR